MFLSMENLQVLKIAMKFTPNDHWAGNALRGTTPDMNWNTATSLWTSTKIWTPWFVSPCDIWKSDNSFSMHLQCRDRRSNTEMTLCTFLMFFNAGTPISIQKRHWVHLICSSMQRPQYYTEISTVLQCRDPNTIQKSLPFFNAETPILYRNLYRSSMQRPQYYTEISTVLQCRDPNTIQKSLPFFNAETPILYRNLYCSSMQTPILYRNLYCSSMQRPQYYTEISTVLQCRDPNTIQKSLLFFNAETPILHTKDIVRASMASSPMGVWKQWGLALLETTGTV